VKTEWLKALRSGKYKQGNGCLRDGQDNFCCLGVLADIHPDLEWGEHPIVNISKDIAYIEAIHKGRNSRMGDYISYDILEAGIQGELASLNDDANYSFEELADFIEQRVSDDLMSWKEDYE